MREKGYLQTEYVRESNFPLSLYNCAVNHSSSLRSHYHDNFEIIYIKEGKINIRIGNETYYSEGENIFFSNMFQVHSARSADGLESKFYAILFDKQMLDTINVNDYFMNYIRPFLVGEKRFPARISSDSDLYKKLTESLNLIINEYNTKERAYEVFIKTEIERIFASMVRYCDFLDSGSRDGFSVMHKKIMDDMWVYVQSNYQRDISLDEISKFLNINKHYFCRLIKKLTGKPFTQLLNMHRIYQAEKMLKETDIPVSEILEITGFSNQSYFNRIYMKYIGNTPTATRKRLY
ncbi:hypothetical protein AN1V17_05620 [Vallitalea sediminicola]